MRGLMGEVEKLVKIMSKIVVSAKNKRIFRKYQLAPSDPNRRKGFLGIRLRIMNTVAPWKSCHQIMLAT